MTSYEGARIQHLGDDRNAVTPRGGTRLFDAHKHEASTSCSEKWGNQYSQIQTQQAALSNRELVSVCVCVYLLIFMYMDVFVHSVWYMCVRGGSNPPTPLPEPYTAPERAVV